MDDLFAPPGIDDERDFIDRPAVESEQDSIDAPLDSDRPRAENPDDESEDEATRRRRRRGRRGGRRRRSGRSAESASAEKSQPAPGEPSEDAASWSDDDEFEDGSSVEDDVPTATPAFDDLDGTTADSDSDQELSSDDSDEGGFDKNAHKGIPAWEDAIGCIIVANMEARARSPGNQASRPRGGRRRSGRGDGRRDERGR